MSTEAKTRVRQTLIVKDYISYEHSQTLLSIENQVWALNKFQHGLSRLSSFKSQHIFRLHTPVSPLSTLAKNSSPRGTASFSLRLGQLQQGSEISDNAYIALHHIHKEKRLNRDEQLTIQLSQHPIASHCFIKLATLQKLKNKNGNKIFFIQCSNGFEVFPACRGFLWLLFPCIWANHYHTVGTDF